MSYNTKTSKLQLTEPPKPICETGIATDSQHSPKTLWRRFTTKYSNANVSPQISQQQQNIPQSTPQKRYRNRDMIRNKLQSNYKVVEIIDPPINEISKNVEIISKNCKCCGILLEYPISVNQIKCLKCHTYHQIKLTNEYIHRQESIMKLPPLSYHFLKETIKSCEREISNDANINKKFLPVENMVSMCFSNHCLLNRSFIVDKTKKPSYNTPNLNFNEIKRFYALLDELPSKKPMFKLLVGALHALRHPPSVLDTLNFNWMLIILECPLLYRSLNGKNNLSAQFRGVSYDIIKRIFGFIAYLDPVTTQNLCHWWSRLPTKEFQKKVDIMNLYITFHLNRLYTHILLDKRGTNIPIYKTAENINYKDHIDVGLFEAMNNEHSLVNDLGLPLPGLQTSIKNKNKSQLKITITLYSEDWHLMTASKSMSYLFTANKKHRKISDSSFYNNLVDFVNVTQDFDVWQFNVNINKHENLSADNPEKLTKDMLVMQSKQTYLGVNLTEGGLYSRAQFTFCSFPFLISLGTKISILEHDAKRTMGRNAELAFISSFADRKLMDVHFNMRVRRSHITIDSLRKIQSHPNDVKKSLKVEFVDEPGIDAGGLKKEWFLLLTKELFDPSRGLFNFSSESGLAYFSINSIAQDELYFLVGVVVGMAIYNSTILDVKFCHALYNKMMGKNATLDDFIQLEPTTGVSLKKLLKMQNVESLYIYFNVTYKDMFGEVHQKDLIKNGSNILVTDDNKYDYVFKYYNFFLNDLVADQFGQFLSGFKLVMGSNALSLFTPDEIQLLLVGDNNEKSIDIDILKSITVYTNCSNDDTQVRWFWEYFGNLQISGQRKLLRFVTGSDRLPATGLLNLNFKITKINYEENTFSDRLPISHTCFNELCLFNWENKEKLYRKMDTAIYESNGFELK
ncbi:putative E3 ubiquitin-protein ligase [Martiniozyma asiatica (nom. inval.)]|nr:putative E3 ubiquitin-protein ligase [Martiniozyma asiatica]